MYLCQKLSLFSSTEEQKKKTLQPFAVPKTLFTFVASVSGEVSL